MEFIIIHFHFEFQTTCMFPDPSSWTWFYTGSFPFLKNVLNFIWGGVPFFFYLIVNLNLQKIKKWVTLIHLRKIGPL